MVGVVLEVGVLTPGPGCGGGRGTEGSSCRWCVAVQGGGRLAVLTAIVDDPCPC